MIYPGNNIQGWKTDEELQWLYNRSREMASIIEIGCWRGRATHALTYGCAGEVHAVDPLDPEHYGSPEGKLAQGNDIFKDLLENMKEFINFTLFRMESREAAKTDRVFDMVFLDHVENEAQYLEDIDLWLPKARKMISGYDYREGTGVIEAVSKRFDKVHTYGNIWFKTL